ncbi:FG-GAP repeat protein [Endozoicomonas sp. ONNA2]|uniref:FG-GAP repeat protein n=1 Tax=Endozoicomonas sp. ONNA2 TaxID=2828741 RepID=UPI0035A093B6
MWTEQAKLVASDKETNDFFGVSCSISGDGSTALVGVPNEAPDGVSDAGAAYISQTEGGNIDMQIERTVTIGEIFAALSYVVSALGACIFACR